MKCTQCGAELMNGAKFCHVCTAPVPQASPQRPRYSDDEVDSILNEYRSRNGIPAQSRQQRPVDRSYASAPRTYAERPAPTRQAPGREETRYAPSSRERRSVPIEPEKPYATAPRERQYTPASQERRSAPVQQEQPYAPAAQERRNPPPAQAPFDEAQAPDRSRPASAPPREPQKKKPKKALWISIIALILVVAILSGVIFIITTVSAKEIQEAKDNYQPPAQAFTLDLSKSDPSTDDVKFDFDDSGRIITCTYTLKDKEYKQRYLYDDIQRVLEIITSFKDKDIYTWELPYDDVTSPDTYEEHDGYIVILDEDSLTDTSGNIPPGSNDNRTITDASDRVSDKGLKDFLTAFILNYTDYGGDGSSADAINHKEYDCRHAAEGTQNILTNVCSQFNCVNYTKNYNNNQVATVSVSETCPWPDKTIYETALAFDRSTSDWICKNIFHITDDDIATLYQKGYDQQRIWKAETDDGECYCAFEYGKGGPMGVASVVSVRTDGTYYYVTYNDCGLGDMSNMDEPGDVIATYYAVMGKETIDGKEYWTMYYNTVNVPETATLYDPRGKEASGEKPAASATQAPSDDFCAAYAKVLSGEDSAVKFHLIYVDDDDIPEMVFIPGVAHLHQGHLYTYYNGEAVLLGTVGAYGTFPYSERNNRIFGYTGMQENAELEAKYTYMIQNGALVQAPDYEGYTHTSADYGKGYENTEENRSLLASGSLS